MIHIKVIRHGSSTQMAYSESAKMLECADKAIEISLD
jgi:hypothetical protein